MEQKKGVENGRDEKKLDNDYHICNNCGFDFVTFEFGLVYRLFLGK